MLYKFFRLSAIRSADRILFIEKGKIIEEGSHDGLVQKQGSYYNMMKGGLLENEQSNLANEIDSENNVSQKLVEKVMFTESQLHENLDKTDGIYIC